MRIIYVLSGCMHSLLSLPAHRFIVLIIGFDKKKLKQLVSIIWMHALAPHSPQESFPTHRFIVPILGFDK
ncbi:hypothetical protein CDAR_34521 [Caerostris darwini]|uniref:Uncharacterized protein n=1 Tax=Caerostris darwini TaxID=1538125 RepID=A0AAV4QEJ6_9ARAC|nr:hypothetical protein CDAR_34521 [Caerostris darwini]